MDLYSRCRDQTIRIFEGLTTEAVKKSGDVLFEYAEKAGNNQQQSRFFEAMRQLQERQGAFVQTFSTSLGDSFEAFRRGDDEVERQPAADEQGPLALVDKERFEDEIAVSMMVSRANAKYAEPLWKLNRRLAVLRGGKKLTDESNPCGPRQLCVAMHRAVQLLDVETTVKIILYKLFDKHVLTRIGGVYDKLNDELARAGILANLTYEIIREPVAVAASGGRGGPAPAPDAAGPTGPGDAGTDEQTPAPGIMERVDARLEARQAQLLEMIRQVQHRQLARGADRTRTAGGVSYGSIATDGKLGGADTFDDHDFAFALSAVQSAVRVPTARGARPADVEDVERRLVSQLARLGESRQRSKISGADADTIDLVGMLFKFMLDDPNLPDQVKALLSHLHTPYLKVALIDKQFFARASHPARQLLNAMAAAGARWAGDDQESERQIVPRIRSIVERILGDFVDDVSIFGELLEEFSSAVLTLEKRARLAEQRSLEAEKGLDRLVIAKARAEEEVDRRMRNARLPEAVEQLLLQPWTDFLVFNHLRHGEDSVTWHSALKVVDGVIASLEPVAESSRERQRESQAKLRRSISDGLVAIGYNSDEGERLLAALADAHDIALRGEDPAAGAPAPEERAPDARTSRRAGSAIGRQLERQRQLEETGEAVDPEAFTDAQREILERLQSIEFGTWFEFRRSSDNRVQRLKLAWYSSVSGNYMFVNSSGVKGAVKPLHALVHGIDDGSVTIATPESRSLVERALGAILHRLRGD